MVMTIGGGALRGVLKDRVDMKGQTEGIWKGKIDVGEGLEG